MSFNRNYGKPENALKRADELVGVGHREAAIQVLHDVLVAKKYRPWVQELEDVCVKYVELCIAARDARMGKDGLYQFRTICQHNNFSSLEVAVRFFIDKSEERVEKALADAKVAQEKIEAEDAELSPEALWLKATCGDGPVERSDREHISPWLKFLWESYRTTLDLLKLSSKLEHLYHETAQRAFRFCVRHERKTDFRRLCEIIRTHLQQVAKFQQAHQGVTLSNPETLNLQIETRLHQLSTAVEMELFQESYRTIEDVSQLFSLSKKAIKPSVLISFYAQLANIFWVSKEEMFHAAALQRIFVLSRYTGQDLSAAATRAVVATLSVPVGSAGNSEIFDEKMQKAVHLSSLLGYRAAISRDSLVSDLSSYIAQHASEPAQDLVRLFTGPLQPLQLSAKALPLIEALTTGEAAQYATPLRHNVFATIARQIGDVFEAMSFARFQDAVAFLDRFELEREFVCAVKAGAVDARLDLRSGAIQFGARGMDAKATRRGLVQLAKGLRAALNEVTPDRAEKAKRARQAAIGSPEKLAEVLEAERQAIMVRKAVIEERKLKAEQLEKQKMKERDAELRAQRQRQHEQTLEQQRIKEEWEAEQKKRIATQIAVQESRQPTRPPWAEEASRQAAGFGAAAKPAAVKKEQPAVVPGLGESEEQSAQQKIREQQEAAMKLAKEKEKLHNKLQNIARTMRYTQRAEREAEIPLLETWFDEHIAAEKTAHETRVEQEKEMRRTRHAFQLAEKQRLERMQSSRPEFEKQLMARRQARFAEAKAAQDKRMAPLRAQIQKEKDRLQKLADEEERRKQEAEERRIRQREEKERRIQELERERLEAEARKMEERKKRMESGGGAGAGGSRSWGAREDDDDTIAPPAFDERPRREARDEGPQDAEPPAERESKWGRKTDSPSASGGSKWGRGGSSRDGGDRDDRSDRGGRYDDGPRDDRDDSRSSGSKWGRGGDRDRGSDRYGGDRDRGSDRYGGDRDRGSDRYGGDRDRGSDRYGGDRDRPPAERESKWGRGGGGGSRYGDRDRGSDRYGGDRDRGSDRYGGGGERPPAERESKWGRGGGGARSDDRGSRYSDRDRDGGDRDRDGGSRDAGSDRGGSKWGRGGRSNRGDDAPRSGGDDGFTTVRPKKRW